MPSFFLPGITVWWRHRTVSPHCSVPATSYRGPPPLTVRSEESRVRSFKGGHKICHALVSEHAMWCSCCQSLPSGCKGMRRTWQSSTPSFCGPGQWKRRVVMSSLAKNERPERTSDVFAWQCPQHPQIAIASRLEAIASRLKTIAIRLSLLLSFLYLRLFMSPPGRLVFFVNVASHTTHCRCIAHLVAQLAHGFYHLPCVDLVPKHIVPGRSSKTRTVA